MSLFSQPKNQSHYSVSPRLREERLPSDDSRYSAEITLDWSEPEAGEGLSFNFCVSKSPQEDKRQQCGNWVVTCYHTQMVKLWLTGPLWIGAATSIIIVDGVQMLWVGWLVSRLEIQDLFVIRIN